MPARPGGNGDAVPQPRPCVVLGCGRSGTSLAAGLLAEAGYDLGPRLLPPDPSNPKGFFESRTVNALNERLLAPLTDGKTAGDPGSGAARPLRDGERWLAALAPDVAIPPAPALAPELEAAAGGGGPVARKDPRFVWTLPAWDDVLPGAVRVCVFREPLRTARSILGMTDTGDLGLTLAGAVGVWTAAYRRCLHLADAEGGRGWLFVHYDQLVDGTALPALSESLGAPLPGGFADAGLRRSRPEGDVPTAAAAVYYELRARVRLP